VSVRPTTGTRPASLAFRRGLACELSAERDAPPPAAAERCPNLSSTAHQSSTRTARLRGARTTPTLRPTGQRDRPLTRRRRLSSDSRPTPVHPPYPTRRRSRSRKSTALAAVPRSDRARPRSRPAAAGVRPGPQLATAAPALATFPLPAVRASAGARTTSGICQRSTRTMPSRTCGLPRPTRTAGRAAAAASATIATLRSLPGDGLTALSLRRAVSRASRRPPQRPRLASHFRRRPLSASASARHHLL
jgi:hypothetical protein